MGLRLISVDDEANVVIPKPIRKMPERITSFH
jgi:hypothetical protein